MNPRQPFGPALPLAFLLAVSAACGANACGGKSVVDEGNSGTGGTSAADGGNTGGTSGLGGTGGSGAAAGFGGTGGDGGAASCSDYMPVINVTPVTLRVVNETGADLFLGDPQQSCGIPTLYSLAGVVGDPPPVFDSALDICELTCEGLQQYGCACAADCAMPAVIRVTPGGTYDMSWSGYVLDSALMPSACYFDTSCYVEGATCPIPAEPPSSLRILSQAYEHVDCDGAPCSCEPESTGSCMVYAGLLTYPSPTLSAEVVWTQGDQLATLVFSHP